VSRSDPRRARAPLDAAGIDVVAAEIPECPGRIAVVLVDAAGDRTVLERRDPRLVFAAGDITAAAIATARVLLVDATQPAASVRALELARQAGTVSVSDVDRVSPEADRILALVDVVVVPAPFALQWAGTSDERLALERLAAHCRHATLVVATRGAEGSLAWCRAGFVDTPGLAVAVVDTTGAGDAFRAGLVTALIRLGPDVPLEHLLRFANATGALNCRVVGAQAGLPSFDEVWAHVTSGSADLSK
jgi:sugar/nucleoside kinase (ribokinase family)